MTATPVVVNTVQPPSSKRVQFRLRLRRFRDAALPRAWTIRLDMRENSRYYAERRAEARAAGAKSSKLQELDAEAAHFYWVLKEERDMLRSRRVLDLAESLGVPEPEFVGGTGDDPDADPNWEQGSHFKPTWYLRPSAVRKLRAEIRAERKARREPIGDWVKILGAAIGGLGGAAYLVDRVVRLAGG